MNFTLYTYWVPALSMFAGSRWLLPMEVERARPRERPLYAKRQPVVGILAAGCALLVVFVWLNVAIADWFSSGTHVYITFERQSARDLATSLAWAVYAIALLAAGTRWSSPGLRAVSLAVLLLTIGKVFLYDLSNLHDLYRVMSLLGLAVSLIARTACCSVIPAIPPRRTTSNAFAIWCSPSRASPASPARSAKTRRSTRRHA